MNQFDILLFENRRTNRSFCISSSKYKSHPFNTSTCESRNTIVSPVAILAAKINRIN